MASNKLGTNIPQVQDGRPSLEPNRPPPANFMGMKKVRILIEDHPDIPPTGLFLSHNGRTYMVQSGVEVDVPLPLLEILDNAITSVPIVDGRTLQMIGSRKKMRFPYRLIQPAPTPAQAA